LPDRNIEARSGTLTSSGVCTGPTERDSRSPRFRRDQGSRTVRYQVPAALDQPSTAPYHGNPSYYRNFGIWLLALHFHYRKRSPAPPLDRHDGSSPRSAAADRDPELSIGDRKSLDRAYVYISADLGGAVVEHGFEVKSTAHPVVDVDQNRTRRCQVTVTQKIDIPEFGANGRNVNLDDRHPRVVGKLDPTIQRQGRRPGRGLEGANDRSPP